MPRTCVASKLPITSPSRHQIQRIACIFLCSSYVLHTTSGQDYTCTVPDACPTSNNGICESNLSDTPSENVACQIGDCADCDSFCAAFNYDCNSCLSSLGCYWCPGDGRCTNSPLNSFGSRISECGIDPDAYLTGPDTAQCSSQSNFFSDPLYDAQAWVFDMIDLLPVWEKQIFGTGVRVRINDDGIDGQSAEILGRLDEEASCENFAPEGDEEHGTLIASVLGGTENNDICAVGVAPGVLFSSCNVYAGSGFQPSDFVAKLDQFDISQNSIGLSGCKDLRADSQRHLRSNMRRLQTCPFTLPGAPPCLTCDFETPGARQSTLCESVVINHCEANFREEAACLDFLDILIGGFCEYNQLPKDESDAFQQGVNEGRDGKGIIYVFGSGNSFEFGDDVNFSGLTNSRLTITVGAVSRSGLHASYSTPGAALLVSAPGGDGDSFSQLVGATRTGTCTGNNAGTSFATPIVSGVVALMLQENPDLSWRDVQGILVATSRVPLGVRDTTRITNEAGFTHSNLYGYGIVNASSAVEAATEWELYCPETVIVGESEVLNLLLSDDQETTLTNSITIESLNATDDFIVETVTVQLDIRHFSRGDLEVKLTSPAGTTSTLLPGKRPENTQFDADERWKLMTVRNWGETAVGDWTLDIQDLSPGDAALCVDAPYNVRFLGRTYNCEVLTEQGFCFNQTVNEELLVQIGGSSLLTADDNGFTLEDACCDCGGGFETEDFEDTFRQWRIVLNGRQADCVDDENPPIDDDNSTETNSTMMPSESMAPSSGPQNSAPALPRDFSTGEKVKVDKMERLSTIMATILALSVTGLCLWYSLRGPSQESSSRGCFKKSYKKDDASFQSANGSIT